LGSSVSTVTSYEFNEALFIIGPEIVLFHVTSGCLKEYQIDI
jgi:hypothetical protein